LEHDLMLAVTPRHGQGGAWRFALGLASAAPDASTTESLPHSRSRDDARNQLSAPPGGGADLT
jgi:hypothetical protein